MSVPAVQRIVVGVDGSAESAAALRWACREAALRGAEVHAVHVREANCHSLASYAVPASPSAEDEVEEIWSSAQAEHGGSVEIRTEVADGLAARVLLDRCAGADMLILGTVSDVPGASRSAGPVIRACLRRAPCPVVVISAAQDAVPRREPPVRPADVRVPTPVGVGAPVAAAVPAGV
jgi:nucleotide-binding universal stress UspA family protein